MTSTPTPSPAPHPTATDTKVTTTVFSVDIEAVTPIDAPADRAWNVLADTDSYPEWNPLVRRFDGPLVEGQKVAVELHLPGRKPQSMSPRIVEVVPGRAFEWLGGTRGVFDGRHRFEIRAVDARRCELVQSERLSGLLVPAFKKMLTGPTPAAFTALNDAFKVRVEVAR